MGWFFFFFLIWERGKVAKGQRSPRANTLNVLLFRVFDQGIKKERHQLNRECALCILTIASELTAFCFQLLLMFDKLYRLEELYPKGLEAHAKTLNTDLALRKLWFPIFQVTAWIEPGCILLPVIEASYSSQKTKSKSRRRVWPKLLHCHWNFIFEKWQKRRNSTQSFPFPLWLQRSPFGFYCSGWG